MLVRLLMLLLLLPAGCGYHLVGHGTDSGVIPEDTTALLIQVQGGGDAFSVRSQFRQALSASTHHYVILDNASQAVDDAGLLTLTVQLQSPQFSPAAYDASGIASQYRMTYQGSLRLQRGEKVLWESGSVVRHGDLFISGNSSSIDAARERLREDLRQQWVEDALQRLRSSF